MDVQDLDYKTTKKVKNNLTKTAAPKPAPAKTEPVKAALVKTEPVKVEPFKSELAKPVAVDGIAKLSRRTMSLLDNLRSAEQRILPFARV